MISVTCWSRPDGFNLVCHPQLKSVFFALAGIQTRDPDHDLDNQIKKTDALDRLAMIIIELRLVGFRYSPQDRTWSRDPDSPKFGRAKFV